MAVQTLDAAPSLGPLYARAALTGPLHRGGELPDSQYSLAATAIDREHLAAYQRVCGFRTTDVLPPTYLHILAFPLSVALMVEQKFPFPLVGLVHVNNAITVERAVTADEAVAFDVGTEGLRDHPAGKQFDVVARARIDGETVWSGRSTYLRRGGKAPDKRDGKRPPADALDGAVARVRVPENIGRRYGAISGDRNPIHIHALTARAFGFPKAIAHGMWLKARTLAALEGRLPEEYVVDVAFKTPVLLPSTIAIATARDGLGWSLDVRNDKSGKPHLSGSVRPS